MVQQQNWNWNMQKLRVIASHYVSFYLFARSTETMCVVKKCSVMAEVKIVLIKHDNELRD